MKAILLLTESHIYQWFGGFSNDAGLRLYQTLPIDGYDQHTANPVSRLTPREIPSFIAAHQVFDGTEMRGPCLVGISNGKITEISTGKGIPDTAHRLPEGSILAPGFIDIQVNGGGGVLLNNDISLAALQQITSAHRRMGTTGLLPTLITDAPDRMAALDAIADEALAIPGILGFHLEGPFLNPARKGIHTEAHIRRPSPADIAMLKRFARHGASLVTVAPEQLEAGTVGVLAEAGLRIAIGHSEATALEAMAAADEGATCVTHLFNAMSQMGPRAPGIVGAALTEDRLYAGIIADGLHVAPMNLKTAWRAMGRDRLMLITDAMALIGSEPPLDVFMINGRRITLRNGLLTGEDGTLGGAHIGMLDTLWNAVEMMACQLEDALVMASRTPAAFLGLAARKGRIAEGFDADLTAFRGRQVVGTWIGGRA
jgi:N-acetylglucosamine-6-phosphate deacetylase